MSGDDDKGTRTDRSGGHDGFGAAAVPPADMWESNRRQGLVPILGLLVFLAVLVWLLAALLSRDKDAPAAANSGDVLAVTVADPDGRPVTGARVDLVRRDGAPGPGPRETDDEGVARFHAIVRTRYAVTATAAGVRSRPLDVEVKKKQVAVSVTLPAASLHGRVRVQAIDAGVVGAGAVAFLRYPNGQTFRVNVTAGQFRFARVPPGKAVLRFGGNVRGRVVGRFARFDPQRFDVTLEPGDNSTGTVSVRASAVSEAARMLTLQLDSRGAAIRRIATRYAHLSYRTGGCPAARIQGALRRNRARPPRLTQARIVRAVPRATINIGGRHYRGAYELSVREHYSNGQTREVVIHAALDRNRRTWRFFPPCR